MARMWRSRGHKGRFRVEVPVARALLLAVMGKMSRRDMSWATPEEAIARAVVLRLNAIGGMPRARVGVVAAGGGEAAVLVQSPSQDEMALARLHIDGALDDAVAERLGVALDEMEADMPEWARRERARWLRPGDVVVWCPAKGALVIQRP